MSKIRVCFLGTPEFAAVALKALLEDEHFEVVGVVTQPDRPSGRKLQLTPSAVKVLAQKRSLPVITPEKLKADPEALQTILSWKAEAAIVVAFGQILHQEFLDSFNYGCVNVHGSILPRWRGAAPIQRAIEAGDAETGVALQKMVKKLDAGDVIGEKKIKIHAHMGAQELHDKLAVLGAELLKVEFMDYVRGNLAPIPQDEQFLTYAKKIEKTESKIDFNKSATEIDCKIRAFEMGPGTYAQFKGLKVKTIQAQAETETISKKPGTVIRANDEGVFVATANGILKIKILQPESKNRMPAADFVKGYKVTEGDLFE